MERWFFNREIATGTHGVTQTLFIRRPFEVEIGLDRLYECINHFTKGSEISQHSAARVEEGHI